jgi:ATPase subunit of ABC transporter with duplicated ATPase domains
VLRIRVGETALSVVGPERIRITGDNGAGKSTLLVFALDSLLEPTASPAPQGEHKSLCTSMTGYIRTPPRIQRSVLGNAQVELAPTVPTGMLAQNLDGLDVFPTALDAVRDAAPGRTPHEARALLARFLIRGGRADQPPSTMSGGERFRVGLARTLFADPAPQLLILDEPTNNIDLASAEQLVAALDDYRGALLIVTHDEHLARDLRVERTWHVTKRETSIVIADDLAGP